MPFLKYLQKRKERKKAEKERLEREEDSVMRKKYGLDYNDIDSDSVESDIEVPHPKIPLSLVPFLEPSANRPVRSPSALWIPRIRDRGFSVRVSEQNQYQDAEPWRMSPICPKSISRPKARLHKFESLCLSADWSCEEGQVTQPLTRDDLPQDMILALSDILPEDRHAKLPLRDIPMVVEFALKKCLDSANNRPYKKKFLELLQNDFENEILCRNCQVLHVPNKFVCGTWRRREMRVRPGDRCPKAPVGEDPDEVPSIQCPTEQMVGWSPGCESTFPNPVRFSQLQYAMKRYRLGLSNLTLLQALNMCRIFQHMLFIHLWDSKVKLKNDRLYVRTQHFFMFPVDGGKPATSLRLLLRQPLNKSEFQGVSTCRHEESLRAYLGLLGLSEDGESPCPPHLELNEPRTTGLQRCSKNRCAAEFQIDIFRHDKKELICVITTWRDLGRCLSPFDPRFRCHFNEFRTGEITQGADDNFGWRDNEESIDFRDGDIKAAFQGDEEFDPGGYLESSRLILELRNFKPTNGGERKWTW